MFEVVFGLVIMTTMALMISLAIKNITDDRSDK
jgi:hypothetical protein